MTDATRDLLISLASHMAYMQGQLEAHHELDDPEDYYWYRESVLLRQKVTDALAAEPAVPDEGREPATWTEGVCGDGAALLKDGVMVPIEAVVRELNEGARARAVLARWGNLKGSLTSSPPADVSQLSDGYHTFADLYEHRHSLMLALMRALSHICWFSRRHADGELPFGSDDWFIVGAELPGAPITYHLPAALYPLAQKTGALELPTGRPWDGHSAADVVQRLRDWAIAPAPPADGEVTPDSCNRGLLPMIVSATGDPDEPELERIICSSISNGADYLNGMPRELSLQRITAEGSVFARYIQGPRSPELTLNSTEQPAPPADGEVADRAAELLQRQVLVPVSVSERLPGPEDCDAQGRCWWLALHQSWPCLYLMKADIALAAAVATHWLPAHALPLPEVNND